MTSTADLKRPSDGTRTARVWQIADQLSQRAGRKASRKEVIEAFTREGGNQNTAATQYHLWSLAYVPPSAVTESAQPESVLLQIGKDGRVLIPLALRNALGIDENSKLVARVSDGEMRIVPQKLAFARLQALVREQDRGQGSAAEELLAERRQEANRS